MIRDVLFVGSIEPTIGRGWPAQDAMAAVSDLGLHVEKIIVASRSDIESMVSRRKDILAWPISYTIGSDVRGTLITAVLEQLKIPFVGPDSANLAFSSKLAFKAALKERTRYSSPAYQIMNSGTSLGGEIGFPAVLKTEYSCNSAGVLAVADATALRDAYKHLWDSYGQSIFIEKWERKREYTTAYIPGVGNKVALTASMELRLISNSFYVDNRAKHSNALLGFSRPEPATVARLNEITREIAQAFTFDGYFRLDVLENANGDLFPIEINCLPFLTRTGPEQSYFPMAFELSGELSYSDIIDRIIAHALARSRQDTTFGLLERYFQ